MKKNILTESKYSGDKAINILKQGGIVALRTETVYGVACDASNVKSIEKIYNLKKRPQYNPLIIHVNSIAMASKIALVNELTRKIAKQFWPGPLTLILPKKKKYCSS